MKTRRAVAASRAAREAIALARKGSAHDAVRAVMQSARDCGRAAAAGDPAAPAACGDAGGAATLVARMAYGDETALNDAHDAAFDCGQERSRDACFSAIMAEKAALDVLDALRTRVLRPARVLNRARARRARLARPRGAL